MGRRNKVEEKHFFDELKKEFIDKKATSLYVHFIGDFASSAIIKLDRSILNKLGTIKVIEESGEYSMHFEEFNLVIFYNDYHLNFISYSKNN